MKQATRALAVLLAVLITLSAFAVGAGAITLEEAEQILLAAQLEYQNDLEACVEYYTYMELVKHEAAWLEGATIIAMDVQLSLRYIMLKEKPEYKRYLWLIEGSDDYKTQQVEQGTYIVIFADALAKEKALYRGLAEDLFKPEAIHAAAQHHRSGELQRILQESNLSTQKKTAFATAINNYSNELFAAAPAEQLFAEGKFSESAQKSEALNKYITKILFEEGVIEPEWTDKLPDWLGFIETLPPWLQWVFHYILFGWVWDIWPQY